MKIQPTSYFLTQIDLLQNVKSTNTITTVFDNVLKHQITSTNITVPLINITNYIFTILTNIQYNEFEFKRLLIDLGAAT